MSNAGQIILDVVGAVAGYFIGGPQCALIGFALATGVRGVYRNHRGFRAMISLHGDLKCLGTFASIEEASATYKTAQLQNGRS
jgi:hypothetical protein